MTISLTGKNESDRHLFAANLISLSIKMIRIYLSNCKYNVTDHRRRHLCFPIRAHGYVVS